jgi:hypothetical protein
LRLENNTNYSLIESCHKANILANILSGTSANGDVPIIDFVKNFETKREPIAQFEFKNSMLNFFNDDNAPLDTHKTLDLLVRKSVS